LFNEIKELILGIGLAVQAADDELNDGRPG